MFPSALCIRISVSQNAVLKNKRRKIYLRAGFSGERPSPGNVAPYKIYRPATEHSAPETPGQCWFGESVSENIELCESQTILPSLLKYLPRNGRILESGCGLGRWVFYLKRKGFDISGIDLSQSAIDAAKAYDSAAPIQLDDVLHSEFPDASFDAVISLGVVEHFEQGPSQALAELHRLLKDGGLLFISVPINNLFRVTFVNPLKDLRRFCRARNGASVEFEEYRFTKNAFERYLAAANFEVLETVPDDFLPPKNLGLYADLRFFWSPTRKWELNPLGNIVNAVLRSISPWMACAGALWICRKRSS